MDDNIIFNIGLLLAFGIIWSLHLLYFWVSLFIPRFRSQIKLKDGDLQVISRFTLDLAISFILGLGLFSVVYSEWLDIAGYLYALVSIVAFFVIWEYILKNKSKAD